MPGSRFGKTYTPALLACCVAVAPVCVFVTVTVEPTRTPPVVSATMPVIWPKFCAKDGEAERITTATTTAESLIRMAPPLVATAGTTDGSVLAHLLQTAHDVFDFARRSQQDAGALMDTLRQDVENARRRFPFGHGGRHRHATGLLDD